MSTCRITRASICVISVRSDSLAVSILTEERECAREEGREGKSARAKERESNSARARERERNSPEASSDRALGRALP